MDIKRKATSPCESKCKNQKDYISPEKFDCSFESCESTFEEEEMSKVSIVVYRVSSRNDEIFKGALDYAQALKVWTDGLKFHDAWLFGIGLVQSKNKPFLLDYKLNGTLETDKLPATFNVTIDGANYKCELVPGQAEPVNIGEVAAVRITKTRWRLSPEQINNWMSIYGQVIKPPVYEDAPGVKNIKSDTLVCSVLLKKHIPNLLPAYGRRMNVLYAGQPLTCSKCFVGGHVRAQCPNAQKDWLLDYVRSFYEEGTTSMLLGRWFDLFKSATESEDMNTDN